METSFLTPSFLNACKELGSYVQWFLKQPCPFIFQNLTIGDVVLGTFATSLIIDLFYHIMEGEHS